MPKHITTHDAHQAADALAQTYARSLFDLAEQAGVTPDVADELDQLVALLDDQPQLKQMFSLESIHPKRRAVSLEKIFSGRISDLTYRFLQVLNHKDRLGHLLPIRNAFSGLLREKHGEVDVDVWTAAPIDQALYDRLVERLSSALGRTAVLHHHVDERLLGGMKLRLGDRQFDGSVAMQLEQLRKQLVDAGQEAARQSMDSIVEE